jgi:hypothetical protein
MDITNSETGTSTTKVNIIEIAAAKIYMPWQLHVNKPSIFRCIIPHKIDDKTNMETCLISSAASSCVIGTFGSISS